MNNPATLAQPRRGGFVFAAPAESNETRLNQPKTMHLLAMTRCLADSATTAPQSSCPSAAILFRREAS